MKKYIFSIALAAAACTMTSCGDDFLEKTPDLQVTEPSIYNNADRIEATMNGVYARMKSIYFFGGYTVCALDNRTDDFVNGGNNGYTMRDTYNHAVMGNCIENGYMYYRAYLTINAANTMIYNLENTEDLPISDALKNQYIQNCKFVRSLSWFYLSALFGQPYNYSPDSKAVPMWTEPIADTEHNDKAPSTISEIFAQILSDTQDVSAMQKKSDEGFDCTFPSQEAAAMLRMRVYMCMNQWQNAITEGNKVTGFQLGASVAEMFDSPFRNEETIYSMPMSSNDRGSSQYHPAGYWTAGSGYIDTLNMRTGIMSKEAYALATDARTKFCKDPENVGRWTHYEKYDDYTNFLEWIHIFRYGETLLNLAECYYNLGEEATAAELCQQVRQRSIPTGDILNVMSMRGEELKQAIYNERRTEFACEGMRGLDIYRRAEDFKHPTTTCINGVWQEEVVATPSDRSTYCWAYPTYETTVNGSLE